MKSYRTIVLGLAIVGVAGNLVSAQAPATPSSSSPATQGQQLGYALDSHWYGIPEFTEYMRSGLQKLTLADVNRVIKKYVQTRDLQVVMVTKDGNALRDRLVSDQPSAVKYDAPRPELAAEDQRIGSMKLGIRADSVRIVPLDEVFAR